MDRRNFFGEMKRGLFKTVYEIFEPTLEEQVEKVERIEELLVGRPVKVGPLEHFQAGPRLVYAGGKPYYIYFKGDKLQGIKAICLECQTMIQWASFRETFFCPLCQRQYVPMAVDTGVATAAGTGSSQPHEQDEEGNGEESNQRLRLEQAQVRAKDGYAYIFIEE